MIFSKFSRDTVIVMSDSESLLSTRFGMLLPSMNRNCWSANLNLMRASRPDSAATEARTRSVTCSRLAMRGSFGSWIHHHRLERIGLHFAVAHRAAIHVERRGARQ